MTAMPKEIFSVKYDGQSLQQHEMDVGVLAPALLALSELIKLISRVSSHGEYTATLSVKGNIKTGSIEVELTTQAVSLATQMRDLLIGDNSTALSNLFGITGGISGLCAFILSLIQRHQGKSPSSIEQAGDNVVLHFETHQEIINTHIYQLYNNFEVRQAIYDTLKPLEMDGIDSFSLIKDNTVVTIIDDELIAFIPDNINTPISDYTVTKTLVIESLSFKEKNKWTFHDGQNSIRAVILDEVFLTGVDNGEIRFAKGDWLQVQIRTQQTEYNGKLKTAYEIIKVLQHIKREQYKLDF